MWPKYGEPSSLGCVGGGDRRRHVGAELHRTCLRCVLSRRVEGSDLEANQTLTRRGSTVRFGFLLGFLIIWDRRSWIEAGSDVFAPEFHTRDSVVVLATLHLTDNLKPFCAEKRR